MPAAAAGYRHGVTRFLTLLMLLVFLLHGEAPAQLAQPQVRHMTVGLVAERVAVSPGQSVNLALEMRPDSGWHGYWKNPGDAGAPPRVEWNLPPGWTAGPLLYPVPERMTLLGLVNYVYGDDHALLVTLSAPSDAVAGSIVPVRARLDYLVCSDEVCIPEQADVSTRIRVGEGGEADADFLAYRKALPKPLSAPATFALSDGRLRIAIPIAEGVSIEAPYFFPLTPDSLSHSEVQSLSRNGGHLILDTAPGAAAASLESIEGVLKLGPEIGLSLTAVPGEVPPAGAPIIGGDVVPVGPGSILLALIGALAGGLFLNVMPCVFPILSLKAISLARAGADQTAARREALAYASGIILTCLALGSLLLALRAGGSAAGWAFQLQDPRVILSLLLLVTAIALNLAGLFQLPALALGDDLARKGGASGAFFTGILAAFVATPCTGPFLGFALGAALILPTAAGLAVFAGLGLGLALPFLLLGFIPALRRRLPRPGPWMQRFQRLLSIPMFVTALGLAWILGRQAGVDGMTLGLGSALLVGLSLWWFGSRPEKRGWLVIALVLAFAIVPMPFIRSAEAPADAASGALPDAEPFDEARLSELRSSGAPVFLYFTADWCITCKVNERASLAQSEVVDSFRTKGMRVMVGDWTRGDPDIGRFLQRHGRSGVPLYLYYPPGGEAQLLPQILTVSRLTNL